MPRLIDADKLPKYTGYALSAGEVARAVEYAPTVDAEPVRHGHWDWDGDYICSNCGGRGHRNKWDYCPNCGAKMDEVEDA